MVAMSEKVSAGRKAFGQDLRRAREAAGMTQADAGAALGVVPSAISSWEQGTRIVDLPTATKLDRVYGTNKAITRKWHDLQRGADLDPWFQEISVIEEAAGELRDYQPLVWPGLVQTEAYARALTHDVWPGRSPESVESLVKSRLKRQELLGRPDSPLILMIVEEGVVYRRVGDLGTAEHRDQIQRAVDEIEAGTLRLQIVPRTAPRHHGGTGPFRIYTFMDRPALSSAEHMTGEALIDDPRLVSHCMTVFGLLQAEALSGAQSLGLLKEVLNHE